MRDGLLTDREGGVEDLGAFLDELRDRASAPELPVVRLGRENHHTFCLHLQHLCAMPSVGYRTAARSPKRAEYPLSSVCVDLRISEIVDAGQYIERPLVP